MSEQAQSNNQQMIVIALIVIAALLAAIVGVLVWQSSKAGSVPPPTANNAPAAGQTPGAPAAATPGAPAGMGAPTGEPVAFDAKTATKVPAGMTPEQLLKTYGDDILANKYAEAFKMLPLDKQQTYGDAKAYEAQVKAYGITKFNMGKPTTAGDKVTIVSEQVTPQMPITYTWSFKKVGDQWFVESRTMGGSLQ